MNQNKKKTSETELANKKIAVIRVRGSIRVKKEVKDTLDMLRLYRKNYCVVLNSSKDILGMINKAKDYITWGEIDEQNLGLLKDKRGEKGKEGKIKPFFRLNSPKGGFERKGIKETFKNGGVLGERGEHINKLIKKMI